MADVMVQKTQEWLNNKYGGKPGYIPLDLSEEAGIVGRTGWTTIYALLGALQIELGLNETGTNFGPTTERLFNEMFGGGIKPPIDQTAVALLSMNQYKLVWKDLLKSNLFNGN